MSNQIDLGKRSSKSPSMKIINSPVFLIMGNMSPQQMSSLSAQVLAQEMPSAKRPVYNQIYSDDSSCSSTESTIENEINKKRAEIEALMRKQKQKGSVKVRARQVNIPKNNHEGDTPVRPDLPRRCSSRLQRNMEHSHKEESLRCRLNEDNSEHSPGQLNSIAVGRGRGRGRGRGGTRRPRGRPRGSGRGRGRGQQSRCMDDYIYNKTVDITVHGDLMVPGFPKDCSRIASPDLNIDSSNAVQNHEQIDDDENQNGGSDNGNPAGFSSEHQLSTGNQGSNVSENMSVNCSQEVGDSILNFVDNSVGRALSPQVNEKNSLPESMDIDHQLDDVNIENPTISQSGNQACDNHTDELDMFLDADLSAIMDGSPNRQNSQSSDESQACSWGSSEVREIIEEFEDEARSYQNVNDMRTEETSNKDLLDNRLQNHNGNILNLTVHDRFHSDGSANCVTASSSKQNTVDFGVKMNASSIINPPELNSYSLGTSKSMLMQEPCPSTAHSVQENLMNFKKSVSEKPKMSSNSSNNSMPLNASIYPKDSSVPLKSALKTSKEPSVPDKSVSTFADTAAAPTKFTLLERMMIYYSRGGSKVPDHGQPPAKRISDTTNNSAQHVDKQLHQADHTSQLNEEGSVSTIEPLCKIGPKKAYLRTIDSYFENNTSQLVFSMTPQTIPSKELASDTHSSEHRFDNIEHGSEITIQANIVGNSEASCPKTKTSINSANISNETNSPCWPLGATVDEGFHSVSEPTIVKETLQKYSAHSATDSNKIAENSEKDLTINTSNGESSDESDGSMSREKDDSSRYDPKVVLQKGHSPENSAESDSDGDNIILVESSNHNEAGLNSVDSARNMEHLIGEQSKEDLTNVDGESSDDSDVSVSSTEDVELLTTRHGIYEGSAAREQLERVKISKQSGLLSHVDNVKNQQLEIGEHRDSGDINEASTAKEQLEGVPIPATSGLLSNVDHVEDQQSEIGGKESSQESSDESEKSESSKENDEELQSYVDNQQPEIGANKISQEYSEESDASVSSSEDDGDLLSTRQGIFKDNAAKQQLECITKASNIGESVQNLNGKDEEDSAESDSSVSSNEDDRDLLSTHQGIFKDSAAKQQMEFLVKTSNVGQSVHQEECLNGNSEEDSIGSDDCSSVSSKEDDRELLSTRQGIYKGTAAKQQLERIVSVRKQSEKQINENSSESSEQSEASVNREEEKRLLSTPQGIDKSSAPKRQLDHIEIASDSDSSDEKDDAPLLTTPAMFDSPYKNLNPAKLTSSNDKNYAPVAMIEIEKISLHSSDSSDCEIEIKEEDVKPEVISQDLNESQLCFTQSEPIVGLTQQALVKRERRDSDKTEVRKVLEVEDSDSGIKDGSSSTHESNRRSTITPRWVADSELDSTPVDKEALVLAFLNSSTQKKDRKKKRDKSKKRKNEDDDDVVADDAGNKEIEKKLTKKNKSLNCSFWTEDSEKWEVETPPKKKRKKVSSEMPGKKKQKRKTAADSLIQEDIDVPKLPNHFLNDLSQVKVKAVPSEGRQGTPGRKNIKKKKLKAASQESEDFIPLEANSATKFGVVPLNKIEVRATKMTNASFKEEKLFGGSVKRVPASSTKVRSLKLKARKAAFN